MQKLKKQLQQIDGKGYKAYKALQGCYQGPEFQLHLDYIQGDPFAAPSRIRVVIPSNKWEIKSEWLAHDHRRIAVEDCLARFIGKIASEKSFMVKGSGKSGAILFDTPKQEILDRSAVQMNHQQITICLSVGLPANGRRINAREAEKLLTKVIPMIIQQSIFTIKDETLTKAYQLADQQMAIRREMEQHDWIAFIANGSILPRKSGVTDFPLKHAVPFQSPPADMVSIQVPYRHEPMKGMAIHKGITLIVGGGYHGKSTLLQAIERGVYQHVAGDGREYVLTDPDAVKIRAEDGRQITGVHITSFINHLPHKADTHAFTTENASGSTSQAANVIEAMEIGATTLLIDEDTSATNFMIRDQLMKQLVKKEPITPFIDRIQSLKHYQGISTILVMGGTSDYFAVADRVIMMDEYKPVNVTKKAKAIIEKDMTVTGDTRDNKVVISKRSMLKTSLQTQKGKRKKVQAKGLTTILMGKNEIHFDAAEQLVDTSQTRLISAIIQYLDETGVSNDIPLSDLVERLIKQIKQQGLSTFSSNPQKHPGDIAYVRKHEIAHVLNRIRTLKIKQFD